MARQAYPDVPLFRYDYTDISEAQIADKLRAPALGGPVSAGALHRHSENRVLLTQYVRRESGWKLAQLRLA